MQVHAGPSPRHLLTSYLALEDLTESLTSWHWQQDIELRPEPKRLQWSDMCQAFSKLVQQLVNSTAKKTAGLP